ncbi:hypothetical protein [Kitasatospora sp. MAA4]|uniref:hypothetical protein n=1 Tax=Kitasatospora sp. MAA4 TaxID=3035093 RepID=UPI0024768E9B|nr:hypothetical protein [Kitasatospora sp. MAA4]
MAGSVQNDGGWREESRFSVLSTDPAVRAALDACLARSAAPSPSAKQFLAAWAGTPIIGGSMLRGAERGRSWALSRSIAVTRNHSAEFAQPVGEVIVGVVCSLARTGRPLKSVQQLPDGCTLTAAIPSDARTFGGTLTVTVTRTENGSLVRAAAEIPGQLYDWGVAKRTLATLLADIPALLVP